MPMFYLDKRIQVICDELKQLAVRSTTPVPGVLYKKGTYLYPAEAHENEGEFAPFDSKTMHWYGPDVHYWFYFDCELEPVKEGMERRLQVATQYREWDARNPQFLAFLDGTPIQGLDVNHRDIRLDVTGKHRIDLQAYTGTDHSELRFFCEWVDIDKDVEGLYWDLQVPLLAFPRMEADSRSRMDLERVMNDAINLLDLRTPHSEAFAQSVKACREYLKKHLYEELAGHDEVIATCIGHTHIDVAWWWTVAQTREKTARSFATVLKFMQEFPNYKFMSSQPQLYYFLKERYPELFEQVKQRVAEGRWEPEGGMWVEADCNLTSGESLVRQFIHGKKFFKEEFGLDNRILWLPDVFGYSGALPQIMRKCGIDYFMTTKLAWNQFNKHPYDTFNWRGIDGSEVFTHLITTLDPNQDVKNFFTTYNGMLHPGSIMGGWQRYQNKDINNDILISFGYGDGGGGPTREMLETGDRMAYGLTGIPKVRQEGSLTYFTELEKRVGGHKRLPTWEGELYFEYHRGTLSSMARNKRSNRKAEIHMMDLELFAMLTAAKLGYPAEELDKMWKGILINQFHDILPGSSIHEVYEVTKAEYAALEEKIARMQEERIALLTEGGDGVTVFNTKGFHSSEAVSGIEAEALEDADGTVYPVQNGVAFINNLPSKGWKVLKPVAAREAKVPFTVSELGIETPFYTVAFNADGTIASLFDKDNGREVVKPGQKLNLMRMYEDKPMNYDNWDIDIYHTEKYWDVTDVQSMKWIDVGAVRATLEIERKVSNSTIRQKIHFYAGSRRIDFETWADWKDHQHLLRAHFPVDIHSDEATFEVQFGNLKRKVHTNTSWDWARFESCAQKWMDFSEGHYGVSLLNDCKYGHSVKDGVLGLTLIKSGIVPNPVTDQEEHVFTYALFPHAEGWQQAGTVQEAYRLNQPAIAAKGGNAGESFSLLSVNKPNVIVETVKQAEDGDGWIVRMYECDNAKTPVTLTWNGQIASVEECNCVEETVEPLCADGGKISFIIKPLEIKTLRIR